MLRAGQIYAIGHFRHPVGEAIIIDDDDGGGVCRDGQGEDDGLMVSGQPREEDED